MKVLVTRPALLAHTLCAKIQEMGAEVEFFPTIQVYPTPYQAALQSAVEKLSVTDIAIFISRASVEFAMPSIQRRWHPFCAQLPYLHWMAIGPGTAAALHHYEIANPLCPKHPPFETETLLALQPLQTIKGKQIYIFQGNGGRNLLSQVLAQRGAIIQTIEVYQRCLPAFTRVAGYSRWDHTDVDIMVTTSADCLHNLLLLVGQEEAPWLKDIPIVVVGPRMYKLATELRFKKIFLAMGADDRSIINVLTDFKRERDTYENSGI